MLQKLDQYLVPGFLKRLDRHLLLNYRLLWITKIHYVVFYGVPGWAGTLALLSIYPFSPADQPSVEATWWIFFLLVLIPAGLWTYRQLPYNIENSFGKQFPMMEQLRLLIYVFTLATLLLLPMAAVKMVKWRMQTLISKAEFAKDLNTLNAGHVYFPTTRDNDAVFEKDKKKLCTKHLNMTESCKHTHFNFNYFASNYYPSLTTTNLTDDQSGMVDSMLLILEEQLRNKFVSTTTDAERLNIIKAFIETANKYGAGLDNSAEEVLKGYHSGEINGYFIENKDRVTTNLQSLWSMQYEDYWERSEFLMAVCFGIFCLGNVLVVYQHVGIRTFIFSAISGLVLIILTGLMAAFTNGQDELVLVQGLGLFTGAFIVALSIAWSAAYSRFRAIALVLASVTSPLLFLWLMIMAKEFGLLYNTRESDLFWIFPVGMVLHYVVFLPAYKKLYTRLKALPLV